MKTEKNKVEFWLGIALLTPPLISVSVFLFEIFYPNSWKIDGGATNTYFGLMAIAGSILISNSNKK